MPADALVTLKPGDDSLSSATWNSFVETTRVVRGVATGGGQAGNPMQATVIMVRNDSGEDRDRFDVLGLGGPVILPGDNLLSFQSRICLAGVLPVEAVHSARFVILQEPVPAGMIGRAALAGVTYARVRGDSSLGCVDVTDADTTALTFRDGGSAQVLVLCGPVDYPAGEFGSGSGTGSGSGGPTGDEWAVVRFGNSCVAPAPPPESGSGSGSGFDCVGAAGLSDAICVEMAGTGFPAGDRLSLARIGAGDPDIGPNYWAGSHDYTNGGTTLDVGASVWCEAGTWHMAFNWLPFEDHPLALASATTGPTVLIFAGSGTSGTGAWSITATVTDGSCEANPCGITDAGLGAADNSGVNPTAFIPSVSVAAGQLLLVNVSGTGTDATPASVTIGGTPLTFEAGVHRSGSVFVTRYYLKAPPGGLSGNLVATRGAGTTALQLNAVAVAGLPTGLPSAAAVTANGGGTAPAATITAAACSYTFAGAVMSPAVAGSWLAPVTAGGQDDSTGGVRLTEAFRKEETGGTTTATYSGVTPADWGLVLGNYV